MGHSVLGKLTGKRKRAMFGCNASSSGWESSAREAGLWIRLQCVNKLVLILPELCNNHTCASMHTFQVLRSVKIRKLLNWPGTICSQPFYNFHWPIELACCNIWLKIFNPIGIISPVTTMETLASYFRAHVLTFSDFQLPSVSRWFYIFSRNPQPLQEHRFEFNGIDGININVVVCSNSHNLEKKWCEPTPFCLGNMAFSHKK